MFRKIKTMFHRQPQILVVGNTQDTVDFAEVFLLLRQMDKIAA